MEGKLSCLAKDMVMIDGLHGELADCYDRLASIMREFEAAMPEIAEGGFSKGFAEMAILFRDRQAQTRAETFPSLTESEQIKEFLENNKLDVMWLPK